MSFFIKNFCKFSTHCHFVQRNFDGKFLVDKEGRVSTTTEEYLEKDIQKLLFGTSNGDL